LIAIFYGRLLLKTDVFGGTAGLTHLRRHRFFAALATVYRHRLRAFSAAAARGGEKIARAQVRAFFGRYRSRIGWRCLTGSEEAQP